MRFERGKEEGNQSYGRRNSVRFEKILNFNFLTFTMNLFCKSRNITSKYIIFFRQELCKEKS